MQPGLHESPPLSFLGTLRWLTAKSSKQCLIPFCEVARLKRLKRLMKAWKKTLICPQALNLTISPTWSCWGTLHIAKSNDPLLVFTLLDLWAAWTLLHFSSCLSGHTFLSLPCWFFLITPVSKHHWGPGSWNASHFCLYYTLVWQPD